MKTNTPKSLLLALTAGFAFAACTTDLSDSPLSSAEPRDVQFAITIPDMLSTTKSDATASTNSARGGLTNVDMTAYDLRYQLAVYAADGSNELVYRAPLQTKDAYAPTTFTVRLTPNRDYRVVAWADFVEEGSDADLHYDTQDLTNITFKADHTIMLNDESRDAFFVSQDLTTGTSALSTSLTLKRPFAKLRIVTTDWQLYGTTLAMPDTVRIGYKNCTRFGGINLVTGKATGESKLGNNSGTDAVCYVAPLADAKEYALGYDASPNNRTLLVDYLMADDVKEQRPVHFTFEALKGETSITSYDISTDIPTRRNWLTTLLGNMLTVGNDFTVSIDEEFEDETVTDNIGQYFYGRSPLYLDEKGNPLPGYTYVPATEPAVVGGSYQVSTAAELAWISENGEAVKASKRNIVLNNDIDLRHIFWSPIDIFQKDSETAEADTPVDANQTFDGQGYKIKNLTVQGHDGNAGLFGNSQLNICNLTLENVYFYGVSQSSGALSGSHKNGVITNCHVRHIFIRNEGYIVTDQSRVLDHPSGALLGSVVSTTVSGCSAYDVDIQNATSLGGISGYSSDVCYNNCRVENASLWSIRYFLEEDDRTVITSLAAHKGHTHPGYFCSDYMPTNGFGYWYSGSGFPLVWADCSYFAGGVTGTCHLEKLTAATTSLFIGCVLSNITFKYSGHQEFDDVQTITWSSAADFADGSYTWPSLLDEDGSLSGEATYWYGPRGAYYGIAN